MKSDRKIPNIAIGFAQEIPGGWVFEVGNGGVHRRIHCISGRLATTSLVNVANGEEYLAETLAEFEVTLAGEGQTVVLDSKDFSFAGYEMPNWSDETRTLKIDLAYEVNDRQFPVSVIYEAKAGENFLRKWVEVGPCDLDGWSITSVTIEKMKFKDMVEGVTPRGRYPKTYPSREDNVHVDPGEVDVSKPEKRFAFGDLARAVVTYWGYNEGLYFFTESLTGSEVFHRPTGLLMRHRDYVPVPEGLVTGPAAIGAFSGPLEVGFKRFNEHLLRHWLCIAGKSLPVCWNTWFVTLGSDRPVLSDYDRGLLIDHLDSLKDAGFIDVLQLDLGWEADYPMNADPAKFPNGIVEIARLARERAGFDMGYWVNPFSSSYWKSEIERESPEYLVPNSISGRSGASAICVMSDHYERVKKRFVELASESNARLIYWDGHDWNIPECSSTRHGHRNQAELEVNAWKRLADICRAAHEARPDLVIACFNLPFDNHRLCVVDQEQISDTHSFPTLQSELIQRQQLYQMAWEHPYKAIRGSWYGINWHEAGRENLTGRPLRELIHAEMSMIGNGIAQAGASIDFKQARLEFIEFLKKLFAFRKRFEKHFDTYQHVLGFPDGEHIDGEGHIVDGSGFIVLVNPATSEQSVRVPLGEPELELSPGKKHELSDWSTLQRAFPLGSFTPADAPEVDLAPLEVKYIGVNLPISRA